MRLSLRRGERIFINGAVLRVDSKVCIELMNDVTFLLEHHIIHPDHAKSPLKQLYLTIQTILMAPADSDDAVLVCLGLIRSFMIISQDADLIGYLIHIRKNIEEKKHFEALKLLRKILQDQSGLADRWDNLLSNPHTDGGTNDIFNSISLESE